jgi:N-acetylglucosaminyl-diphospho-decaprenol L-rhamnosyltransferase
MLATGTIEVSFCVVNTSKRELLIRCLDAIAAERASLPLLTEAIVLDNASADGSAEVAREHPAVDRVIALRRRRGKALNDSHLLTEARGEFALLLNEDSELMPGATLALYEVLKERPRAALAGAALVDPAGRPQPCAWRFPTAWTALAGALFLHRALVVQSGGDSTREVDWCQSSALMVRRSAAEQVGYLDGDFFVYSDEVDFARRLKDAAWRSVHVGRARAIHHEQLSSDPAPERIVEFARNRDLYMTKHHSYAHRLAFRWITALSYALRAPLAIFARRRSARRCIRHVTAALAPGRGDGIREAAEAYNRNLTSAS